MADPLKWPSGVPLASRLWATVAGRPASMRRMALLAPLSFADDPGRRPDPVRSRRGRRDHRPALLFDHGLAAGGHPRRRRDRGRLDRPRGRHRRHRQRRLQARLRPGRGPHPGAALGVPTNRLEEAKLRPPALADPVRPLRRRAAGPDDAVLGLQRPAQHRPAHVPLAAVDPRPGQRRHHPPDPGDPGRHAGRPAHHGHRRGQGAAGRRPDPHRDGEGSRFWISPAWSAGRANAMRRSRRTSSGCCRR